MTVLEDLTWCVFTDLLHYLFMLHVCNLRLGRFFCDDVTLSSLVSYKFEYFGEMDETTRGTPRVQFANIRKMVLCQGIPHCLRLCVDPCMARHAQSLNSSLHG